MARNNRFRARLLAWINGDPDYFGAVVSGYALLALNIAIQLLLVPLYLNYLGKYQFGVLMVLLSSIAYASLGVGWMSGGLLRVMGESAATNDARSFSETYSLAKVVYLLYAGSLSLVVVLGLFLAENRGFFDIPGEYRGAFRLSIIAAAAYFIVLYDFNVERIALTAIQKQTQGNAFQILSQAVFLVSVVPTLLAGGGLVGVLLCQMVSLIIGRAASLLYWRKTSGLSAYFAWPENPWPLVKRLAGPMGAGYMLYGLIILTMQADVLIVGTLGGALAAAEFVIAWKAADVLIQIIWRLPEALAPRLVQMDFRGEHDELRQLYAKGMRRLELASLGAALAYGLLGHSVVSLWVGADRAPSTPWIYWLAGAAVFWLGSARLPAVFAFSTVRLRPLVTVGAAEVVAKLLATWLLFPYLGYAAPLAALSIVHLGGVAWAYRALGRQSSARNR